MPDNRDGGGIFMSPNIRHPKTFEIKKNHELLATLLGGARVETKVRTPKPEGPTHRSKAGSEAMLPALGT